jgi:hypothetical protein
MKPMSELLPIPAILNWPKSDYWPRSRAHLPTFELLLKGVEELSLIGKALTHLLKLVYNTLIGKLREGEEVSVVNRPNKHEVDL